MHIIISLTEHESNEFLPLCKNFFVLILYQLFFFLFGSTVLVIEIWTAKQTIKNAHESQHIYSLTFFGEKKNYLQAIGSKNVISEYKPVV